jgi:hypothetical protein
MKREATKEQCDRAVIRFSGEIPDGEHNRTIEIEAYRDGLRIDDYLTVPWEWIQKAAQAAQGIGLKVPYVPFPIHVPGESESSES